jgi:hypothetical protein
VQQNYIDAAKGGIFKHPQLNESQRMDLLSVASDAVSDMDLVGMDMYVYMGIHIYIYVCVYGYVYIYIDT